MELTKALTQGYQQYPQGYPQSCGFAVRFVQGAVCNAEKSQKYCRKKSKNMLSPIFMI